METVESIRAGDSWRRRLEGLYAAEYPSVVKLAYLLTGERDAAEDVAQEAFVRLFARFQDRKEPEVVGAYLRRIVVNLSRSRVRRLVNDRRKIERAASLPQPPEADPVSPALTRELLMRLPVRQRAALYLRYYEGRSERETAEALGCSIGAVKSLVMRAARTVRSEEGGRDG
ncbi:MAG TPA: sigma-70 family RNA polymerase sigma factor [Actinomycetota bacterium]|nr:sigma-70 family RNA polymerase sigma factor [Actinomycetota bacterium]